MIEIFYIFVGINVMFLLGHAITEGKINLFYYIYYIPTKWLIDNIITIKTRWNSIEHKSSWKDLFKVGGCLSLIVLLLVGFVSAYNLYIFYNLSKEACFTRAGCDGKFDAKFFSNGIKGSCECGGKINYIDFKEVPKPHKETPWDKFVVWLNSIGEKDESISEEAHYIPIESIRVS